MFTVFDENRSWYIKENTQNIKQNSFNTTDPEFYNSNVIYSKFNSKQLSVKQSSVLKMAKYEDGLCKTKRGELQWP